MAYLIDSDWIIDFLHGPPDAHSLISRLSLDGVAISIVTYAEVLEGILFGSDPRGHERGLRQFLVGAKVLGISRSVARRNARLRGTLRAQGMLIAQADLFIAATAIHHDLTLVTRNRRHFDRIPGLKLYP